MNGLIQNQLAKLKRPMDEIFDITSKDIAAIPLAKPLKYILAEITVQVYGSTVSLRETCSIGFANAQMAAIAVFDKKLIAPVVNALINSGVGLLVKQQGDVLHVSVPPFTDSYRQETLNVFRVLIEKGKTAIRKRFNLANDWLKEFRPANMSDDEMQNLETESKKMADSYLDKLDNLFKKKEKEIWQCKSQTNVKLKGMR